MDGLLAVKDAAFGRAHDDPEVRHLFRMHDVCGACVGRLLNHPAVQRVRRSASRSTIREAVIS